MNTKYYILVGIESGQFVMQFGDYNRDCVKDELEDMQQSNCYATTPIRRLSIITLPDARQETINSTMRALNIHN